MIESIFKVMGEEELTTLEIRYHHKTDTFSMEAGKDWDEGTDFSRYNSAFTADDFLTDNPIRCSETQIEMFMEKHGITSYFEEIKSMIRTGKHEAVKLFYNCKLGISFAMFEHNTVRGRRNRLHPLTCGGIRRHLWETPEREVFTDGLNLGRAMTFKNMAAQIPFGGSKITVQTESLDLDNDEVLGFLGYAADRCRIVTAPDMNLPPSISDSMNAKRISINYVGGKNSKIGGTGKPTAYGVYLSLKQAVKFKEGTDSLKGKRILLIGLGAVGWNMAEYVLQEGAALTITDINSARIEEFLAAHKDTSIAVIDPAKALIEETDILCPCASGGLLDDTVIETLQCRYIWGSANNQLKASSVDEEYRLARKLADRGITYQAEWWHNTAGVICMAEEYIHDSTEEALLRRVEEIIPNATYENLTEASALEITPTENCYRKCEQVLYQ